MKSWSIVLFILFYSLLLGQSIKSIDNISNGTMLFDYNLYDSHVLVYENRLIVRNNRSVEEFEILPNGQLLRVAMLERKNISLLGFIEDDRYFDLTVGFSSGFTEINNVGVTVFDLSQSPMQEIISFDSGICLESRGRHFFLNDHFFMIDNLNERSVYFERNTFERKGVLEGFFGNVIVSEDILMRIVYFTEHMELRLLRIIDIHNLEFELLATLPVFNQCQIQSMSIDGNILSLIFCDGVKFVDVSNPYEPVYCFEAEWGYIDHDYFVSAIFIDGFIFTYRAWGLFRAYEVTPSGQLKNIFQTNTHFHVNVGVGNMAFKEPYLYVNAGNRFVVYDVFDNFREAYSSNFYTSNPVLQITQNDVFYFEKGGIDNIVRLYSVLDNVLLCEIHIEGLIDIINFDIHLSDETLFVSLNRSDRHFVYIYQVQNQQAHLMNSIQFERDFLMFQVIGNHAFFARLHSTTGRRTTDVYDIIGHDLILHGSFNGWMPNPMFSLPADRILSYDANRVIAREMYYPLNELFRGNVRSGMSWFTYFGNDYFLLSNLSTSFLYNITDDYSIRLVRNFNTDATITSFNGVISDSGDNRNNSIFYTIRNGDLVQIGEKDESNRAVSNIYFFPERNKMVQVARSGIWVYDFEYEEYVSDGDEVVPVAQTGLLGNFPNPFNPSTSIRFEVGGSRFENPPYPPLKRGDEGVFVQIEVFNIRGQRVRTLLDGSLEFGAGEHSVEWDGRDDSGREVGSGVYLYRMTAGENVSVRRMVLMK